MKKYIVIGLLFGLLALNSNAATATLAIPGGTGCSNLLTLTTGPIKLLSCTVTATTASNTIVKLYDSQYYGCLVTNPANTASTYWVTNMYVTTNFFWTNFFGNTNLLTNNVLVTSSVTVAATTNESPVILQGYAAASSSTVYTLNQYVNHGIWVTNPSSYNASITITYNQ